MVHFTFDHIYPIYPPLYLGCLEQPCRNILWTSESTPVDRCVQPFLHFPVSLDDPNTMNPFFFRWYNLNLNLNHQKDIQKEIASWYLVVPGSAQVDWCWLEPPDHAHGLPPGPAPLDALQSVAAATEAVAAALSWAAGGKGSEESAGVTWPKRDRCVLYIYIIIYIYITLLRVIPTMAFQGILRHKFWHVVLHIFWHFT